MPLYEYLCPKCETKFEELRKCSEREKPAPCPSEGCEGEGKPRVSKSSFVLKGGGWYADGYSS